MTPSDVFLCGLAKMKVCSPKQRIDDELCKQIQDTFVAIPFNLKGKKNDSVIFQLVLNVEIWH